MAKLPNSAVVLRFRLGAGLVKARQRYENTSRAILERVALQYAENEYDTMRKELQTKMEEDVRAELVRTASLYKRHIVGAAGTKSGPTGTLTTVAKGTGAPTQLISSGLPAWKARSREYLRQKRQATGNIAWFDNRGWKSPSFDARYASRRVARKPEKYQDRGLIADFANGYTWERIFGPISVRFFRARLAEPGSQNFTLASKGKRMKIQIGSIQVRALGAIEPNMLPGYNTGTIMASAAGNPSLMGVIGRSDRKLAYRLGTMRNGIYRPTLEPFLGFFLTKALPFAVERRLAQGSLVRRTDIR